MNRGIKKNDEKHHATTSEVIKTVPFLKTLLSHYCHWYFLLKETKKQGRYNKRYQMS